MIVRVLIGVAMLLAAGAVLTVVLPAVATGVAISTSGGDAPTAALQNLIPMVFTVGAVAGVGLVVVSRRRDREP